MSQTCVFSPAAGVGRATLLSTGGQFLREAASGPKRRDAAAAPRLTPALSPARIPGHR